MEADIHISEIKVENGWVFLSDDECFRLSDIASFRKVIENLCVIIRKDGMKNIIVKGCDIQYLVSKLHGRSTPENSVVKWCVVYIDGSNGNRVCSEVTDNPKTYRLPYSCKKVDSFPVVILEEQLKWKI